MTTHADAGFRERFLAIGTHRAVEHEDPRHSRPRDQSLANKVRLIPHFHPRRTQFDRRRLGQGRSRTRDEREQHRQ